MNFGLAVRAVFVLLMFGHSVFLMARGQWVAGMIENSLLMGFLLWGTLCPSSRWFGKVQTHAEKTWLTIDDGPDSVETPLILDLLDEAGVKAAFFVIGEKAERYPELMREITRRGHEVGNHTWSHPQASFWAAGPMRTWREIRRCQEVLTGILDEAPKIFRAPVGHSNFFVHPVIRKLGMRLVGWSCRGYDAVEKDVEVVMKRIEADLDEGAIILIHEGTGIGPEVVKRVLRLMDQEAS